MEGILLNFVSSVSRYS